MSEPVMTVEEAIQHAREWQQDSAVHPVEQAWSIVCTSLADEVERLRSELASVTEANSEYHRDALALEKERDELRRRVAELIHYPDCWDQICYPTIERALENIDHLYQGCTVCAVKRESKIKADVLNHFYLYMFEKAELTPVNAEDNQRGASVYNWYLHFARIIYDYANQIEAGQ